jgi:hypothetical protein
LTLGATLSIALAIQKPLHLALFSKEQMDNLFPLGNSFRKVSNFRANFFFAVFESRFGRSYSGH